VFGPNVVEPPALKLSDLNVDPAAPNVAELSWPDWFAVPPLKLLCENSPRELLLTEL
jgi:hypothetical protein